MISTGFKKRPDLVETKEYETIDIDSGDFSEHSTYKTDIANLDTIEYDDDILAIKWIFKNNKTAYQINLELDESQYSRIDDIFKK